MNSTTLPGRNYSNSLHSLPENRSSEITSQLIPWGQHYTNNKTRQSLQPLYPTESSWLPPPYQDSPCGSCWCQGTDRSWTQRDLCWGCCGRPDWRMWWRVWTESWGSPWLSKGSRTGLQKPWTQILSPTALGSGCELLGLFFKTSML